MATEPTYSFTINGVSRAANLVQNAWTVSQNFGRQGDTASFKLLDELTGTSPNFVPQTLQTIVLTDTNIGQIIFSGLILKPTWHQVSPTLIEWNLDCKDFTYYSDRIIVQGVYLGQTADVIIKDLVTQANAEWGATVLTTTNVQPGPTIDRIAINYKSLSSALTQLAKMASQSTDYGWYIDETRDIHFFNQRQVTASVASFTDTPDNTYPTATKGTYDTGFSYEWDGQDIRDSVIVRGAQYHSSQTDTFVGNGNQSSWPLTFPVDTGRTGQVAGNVIVTLNGAVQSTQILTGSASSTTNASQWVVTQAKSGQWFLVAQSVPGNSAIIVIEYPYVAPIIAQSDNRVAQAAYGGPNNGLFQTYVVDNAITSLTAALSRGQAELQQFQWVRETLQFTTDASWYGHFRAGNTITWSNARVPNSQSGYTGGISGGTFLVSQLNISGTDGNYRQYQATGFRTS